MHCQDKDAKPSKDKLEMLFLSKRPYKTLPIMLIVDPRTVFMFDENIMIQSHHNMCLFNVGR